MLCRLLRRTQLGSRHKGVLLATGLCRSKVHRLLSTNRVSDLSAAGIIEAAPASSSSSSSSSSGSSRGGSSSGSGSGKNGALGRERSGALPVDAEAEEIVRRMRTLGDEEMAKYISEVLASKRGAHMGAFKVGAPLQANDDAGLKMYKSLHEAMMSIESQGGQTVQGQLRDYLRGALSAGSNGAHPALVAINGTIAAFLAAAQRLRSADDASAYKRSIQELEAILVVYTNMQQKYIKEKERKSKKLEKELAREGTIVNALAAVEYNSGIFRECVLECIRAHSVLCAGQVSLFMITNRDYSMFEEGTGQNRTMYKLMAELSSDSMGVEKMLDMVSVVCEHRATALTWSFNFAQLNRFANLMRQYRFFSAVKPTQASFEVHKLMHNVKLKNAITSFYNAVKNGWFSVSICKFLTSITSVTSSFEDLDWMITKVIGNANTFNSEVASRGSGSREMIDIAQLFRAFDEGLTVAIDVANSRKDFKKDGEEFADATPAIMALLRILTDNMKALKAEGSGGFVDSQHLDMIGTYISLSFKLRHTKGLLSPGNNLMYNKMASLRQRQLGHAHVHHTQNKLTSLRHLGQGTEAIADMSPDASSPAEAADSMADSLGIIDEDLRHSYSRLVAFLADPYRSTMEFDPAPGSRRRTFRVLCDKLRLVHKMNYSDKSKDALTVEVTKGPDSTRRPPTLEEIVLQDSRGVFIRDKVFQGSAYKWEAVMKPLLLDIVPKRLLPTVALYATRTIKGRFPQSAWALQWLELLEESGSKMNKGLFKNSLYTCEASHDIYALFEVLYFAQVAARGGKLVKFSDNNVNIYGRDLDTKRGSADADNDDVDDLGSGDGCLPGQYWTKAFRAVWNVARYNSKDRVRQNPVVELMQIMYNSNVDLNGSTIRVLLQFLTASITQSDDWKEITLSPDDSLTTEASLSKLTNKVYKDKRVDISHIECLCMSLLLRRKIKNNICHFRWKLSASKPLYRSPDYLSFPLDEDLQGLSRGLLSAFEEIGMDAQDAVTSTFEGLYQPEGRATLYETMASLVGDGNSTALIYHKASKESIFHIASCSALAAYLVGAKDGHYRRAFDLLWSTDTMVDEYLKQKRSEDVFFNSGSK